jgi:hypothetical protein
MMSHNESQNEQPRDGSLNRPRVEEGSAQQLMPQKQGNGYERYTNAGGNSGPVPGSAPLQGIMMVGSG